MKNITITIDDELYRNARIKAAQESTSVTAMVRDFLIETVNGKKAGDKFDRLLQEQLSLMTQIHQKHPRLNPHDNLTRDDLYDRHAIS